MSFVSALYEGTVYHERHINAHHAFQYPLFMLYLDLQELPGLVQAGVLSQKAFAPLSFCRRDYLGPSRLPLDEAVRRAVETSIGLYPEGPIRMLTQPRYFGFCFNPVTFYYCFDQHRRLQAILAEINNTPWNERFHYVLPVDPDKPDVRHVFRKQFHVSPFFPMDLSYQWHFSKPGDQLNIHMSNLRNGERHFDAGLHLKHRPLSKATRRAMMRKYPLLTFRLVGRIYAQALRLWLKRVPFYSHPSKKRPPEVHVETLKS